jgi:diacylglycerol O-acyltransferase / wax synthase
MSRYAMPAADAAWLHMDRPTNPMVVNGLIMLGEVPDSDALARAVERRLLARFPRFGCRVVEPFGRSPAFEDDPSFELSNHLHRLALPAPGDRSALKALLGDLITPQLDPSRPLWHTYLIEGYGHGAAMLWRIHHCIADGIALAEVMLSLAEGPGAPSAPRSPPAEVPGARRRLIEAPRRAISVTRRLGGVAVQEGMKSLAHPSHIRELAGSALEDFTTMAKLLASPADPPTPLRGALSGTRRAAWSAPLSLERVRDAAHRRRVTINDLLVTALAGALHECLEEDGALPEEIHAMVPVNLRPPGEPIPAELGNDFALILLALPVGPLAAEERLREVGSRMEAIKRSHEAPISFGILSAMGLTPPWIEDRLIGFFSGRASLVVTNVPGPRKRLAVAGAPVEGVLVWAPCSGSIGMTVSIFSYAGEVTAGFMTDTGLVEDPESLAQAYEHQLELLVR